VWFKYPLIIVSLWLLSLAQHSFVSFVNIGVSTPDLVFILFFLLIFFDKTGQGVFTAVIAGLFSDVFLPSYFGISIVSLFFLYFLGQLINYFFEKRRSDYLIFYFITIFSLSFILYNLLLYLFSIIFNFDFNLSWGNGVSLVYSLIIACLGFYFWIKFSKHKKEDDNQLKLL